MQRLLAEKADGWLPSLAYVPRPALVRGNAVIDEAAAAAGRDPRAIRRLLNVGGSFGPSDEGFLHGPPEQWVEQLLPFVVEDGFATFILATDDATTIDRWGREVAPALREAVAAARGSGPGPT
jgi:hypothetical protein